MDEVKLKQIGHTLETIGDMALSIINGKFCTADDIARLDEMLHEIKDIGDNLRQGVIDDKHLLCNWT